MLALIPYCAIDCFKRVSHTRSAHIHTQTIASEQANKQTNIINHPCKHTLVRLASTNTHSHTLTHVSKKTSGVIVNDGPSVYFGKPLLSLQCMSLCLCGRSLYNTVCANISCMHVFGLVLQTHAHTVSQQFRQYCIGFVWKRS